MENNNIALEMSNSASGTSTIFVKPFPDVSKIEIFSSQNFKRWQERVSTLLDKYKVASALMTSKADSNSPEKQIEDWIHANRVCRQTMLSALSNDLFDVYCSYKEAKEILNSLILKYTAENVVRQRFVIGKYYRWEMIEDKDIKIQINEYHKLLEYIKAENIVLPDEFVSELLIEKLSQSWTDYKQQLKHKHRQMSLPDLITHIIIEDTNRKECAAARAKALSAKANMIEDRPAPKRYEEKPDHKKKIKSNFFCPGGPKPTFKKKVNCFICGRPGHHTPQYRHWVKNDNPPKVNIAEGEDTICAVISQVNLVTNVS